MSDLPQFVEFHEEGPREGFQSEPCSYPLEQRAALVEALAATGLAHVQVASFVSPRAVPTMADAPELFAAIDRREGVKYTALWLSERGFERAAATPGVDLDGKMFLYTTDAFCQSNNRCSILELREKQRGWLEAYERHGVSLDLVYVLTAFGCHFQGEVSEQAVLDSVRYLVDLCAETGRPLPVICLADTVGWANPEGLRRRIGAVRELAPEARIGLHLHDTRGMGGANFYAALQMGVDYFDSSVAGLGGCPFAAQRNMQTAGNICTEDMVQMCQEMGIETGIDLESLLEAARLAERIIGRPLVGRAMHGISVASLRAHRG